MTNGEKMKADFPDIEMMGESKDTLDYSLGGMVHRITKKWWNAEYKEPSSSENPNLSENPISSTTKNGISNRTIIYKAKESKDIQEDLEKLEKLNEPTIKNCESCRHYGLHHEICNYCYKCSLWKEKEPTTKNDCIINGLDDFIEFGKKAFGVELTVKKSDNPDTYAKLFGTTKNDLGVVAVSRKAVEQLVYEFLQKGTDENIAFYEHFLDLPSVTPIRPKGHWIEERNDYGEIEHWHCSNCYDDSGFITTCKWDYCPNCGSDNREVEE